METTEITKDNLMGTKSEYYLLNEIGAWGISAAQFIEDFKKYDGQAVDLFINSPGGDVFEGLTIYNFLKMRNGETNVKVIGLAASMASVIAMGGTSLEMAKSAWLMIHNPWGVAVGDSAEMQKQASLLDMLKETLSGIYAAKSGFDVAVIKEMMDTESWLSADGAMQMSFIDGVIEDVQSKAVALSEKILAKFSNIPGAVKKQINKGETMSNEVNGSSEAGTVPVVNDKIFTAADMETAKVESFKSAIVAERARVSAIKKLAFKGQGELVEKLIEEEKTVEEAAIEIIEDQKAKEEVEEAKPVEVIPVEPVAVAQVQNILDAHAQAIIPNGQAPVGLSHLQTYQGLTGGEKTAYFKKFKSEIEQENIKISKGGK